MTYDIVGGKNPDAIESGLKQHAMVGCFFRRVTVELFQYHFSYVMVAQAARLRLHGHVSLSLVVVTVLPGVTVTRRRTRV